MKRKWFKAKNYGWGWYPVTWEGWTVLAVYLVLLWLIIDMTKIMHGAKNIMIPYMTSIFIITSALIYVCYRTGEKPEWRWGPPKKKKKR